MSIHLLNSLQNQYSTKFYVFNKYILRYNKLIFINYITLISYKCQLISNSQSILHGLYLYLYLQKNNLQKVGIIMKKEGFINVCVERTANQDGVSFPLYWKLQYLVNRDETSYENVRNALTECQKHLRNKKQS